MAEVGWPPARLKSEGLAVCPRRVHIRYQSLATWGDQLDVVTYLLELGDKGGVGYTAIQLAAEGTGVAECLLDWQAIDRATGEVQPLQGSLARALWDQVAVAH